MSVSVTVSRPVSLNPFSLTVSEKPGDMHVGRSMWPNDIFGMTAEDDVITLLNIYSCSMAEKKQGEVATLPPPHQPPLPFFSLHLTVKAHE